MKIIITRKEKKEIIELEDRIKFLKKSRHMPKDLKNLILMDLTYKVGMKKLEIASRGLK